MNRRGMTPLEGVYTGALALASVLFPLLGRGDGKLARGIRGRRRAAERLALWAREHRDASRPLVWCHAPSVGEGLQARAVLEALRHARPEVQIVYTFFSPSAEAAASRMPADVTDYLPIDLPGRMHDLLAILRPDVLAFSKTEIWPNLTRAAAELRIPTVLLNATLPASSSRLRRPARRFLRPAHARLSHVAAIAKEDAARFALLGVPRHRISVMGDARFDQVWKRARACVDVDPLGEARLPPLRDGRSTTLVAGSTWPPDEDRLLRALASALPEGFRLILVPHEPTEEHLRRVERTARRLDLVSTRLSRILPGATPALVLVDRVGILGDLYAFADLAYVGGGFGDDGLHSILEPAAYGVPVLFGPNHANAREAGELLAAGGAFSVSDAGDLAKRIEMLTGSAPLRAESGAAAQRYIERGLGAARRGAGLLEALLPG